MVIPGNYKDIETGETLTPVYKFQDAMGIWHEKELYKCTQLELWNYSTLLWNTLLAHEVELQAHRKTVNKKSREVTLWIFACVMLSVVLVYFIIT